MRKVLRNAGRVITLVGCVAVVSLAGLPAVVVLGLPVWLAPVAGVVVLEVIH